MLSKFLGPYCAGAKNAAERLRQKNAHQPIPYPERTPRHEPTAPRGRKCFLHFSTAPQRGAAAKAQEMSPVPVPASTAACMGALFFAMFIFIAAAPAKKTPPASPVDVNSATAEQLAQIPGIGPGTARSIIQFREKSGPFQRVEDLLAIRGITERKLALIKPYVTVGPVKTRPSAKPAPSNSTRGKP
jgi:competence ComEA-like helix-hairpin-helix protein